MSLLIACDYALCKATKLACAPEDSISDFGDWIVLAPFQLFGRSADNMRHGYALCPEHKRLVVKDQWK